MKNNLKKRIGAILCSVMVASSMVMAADAASFGDSKCGASTQEVLQVKYNGAVWNYKSKGSKYNWAYFKYSRNGKTLMTRYAYNGKSTGSVWDDLIHWDDAHTTKFNWNCGY